MSFYFCLHCAHWALPLCRGILKAIFINDFNENQTLCGRGNPHIWPQGNDSKYVRNWGKWIRGKIYYNQLHQNAYYPPLLPPRELLTVMSHYMHCVHVPRPLDVLGTFRNVWGCSVSFCLQSVISHLPWSCNTIYWDRVGRLRSKGRVSFLFFIGLFSLWFILGTGCATTKLGRAPI